MEGSSGSRLTVRLGTSGVVNHVLCHKRETMTQATNAMCTVGQVVVQEEVNAESFAVQISSSLFVLIFLFLICIYFLYFFIF